MHNLDQWLRMTVSAAFVGLQDSEAVRSLFVLLQPLKDAGQL